MSGIHDLALFVPSGLLPNSTPGPDTLIQRLPGGVFDWHEVVS